jgi:hypothetical protein
MQRMNLELHTPIKAAKAAGGSGASGRVWIIDPLNGELLDNH